MPEFPTSPSDVSSQMGASLADKLNAAHISPLDDGRLIINNKSRYKGIWLSDIGIEIPRSSPPDTDKISTVGDEWTGGDGDAAILRDHPEGVHRGGQVFFVQATSGWAMWEPGDCYWIDA
jgi:hypothetical protein